MEIIMGLGWDESSPDLCFTHHVSRSVYSMRLNEFNINLHTETGAIGN
jgi:hypothetical protein